MALQCCEDPDKYWEKLSSCPTWISIWDYTFSWESKIKLADDLIDYEPEPICQKSTRNASIKARERIKNWINIIHGPRGCQESDDFDWNSIDNVDVIM